MSDVKKKDSRIKQILRKIMGVGVSGKAIKELQPKKGKPGKSIAKPRRVNVAQTNKPQNKPQSNKPEAKAKNHKEQDKAKPKTIDRRLAAAFGLATFILGGMGGAKINKDESVKKALEEAVKAQEAINRNPLYGQVIEEVLPIGEEINQGNLSDDEIEEYANKLTQARLQIAKISIERAYKDKFISRSVEISEESQMVDDKQKYNCLIDYKDEKGIVVAQDKWRQGEEENYMQSTISQIYIDKRALEEKMSKNQLMQMYLDVLKAPENCSINIEISPQGSMYAIKDENGLVKSGEIKGDDGKFYKYDLENPEKDDKEIEL